MAYRQDPANIGTVTQFDVLVGGASSAIASVGPGTAGQILQSGGNAANPAYSSSTYPATNAINTLLYASSANVMAALPTANNAILATNATGVPAITTASGNWLNTSRCCFSAWVNGAINNVTGDNTTYTIIYNATNFDQGSNFNTSTGTFTAPVTGKYLLSVVVTTTGNASDNTYWIPKIVTNAVSFNCGTFGGWTAAAQSLGQLGCAISVVAAMSANDTATVTLQVAGHATKNINIANGNGNNNFMGYLIC